jgi:hypothetical protein
MDTNPLEQLVGKIIAVDRDFLGQDNQHHKFFYQGELLSFNDSGLWMMDRKIGHLFLAFSEITALRLSDAEER